VWVSLWDTAFIEIGGFGDIDNVIVFVAAVFCLCHYNAKKSRYFYGKSDKNVI